MYPDDVLYAIQAATALLSENLMLIIIHYTIELPHSFHYYNLL